MASIQFWGLFIASLNILYTFICFKDACEKLIKADDMTPAVWLAIYTVNLLLNTLLFLRLPKSDRIVIILWFSLTVVLLLVRVFTIPLEILNVVLNVYIFISLFVMGIVYKYIPLKSSTRSTVTPKFSKWTGWTHHNTPSHRTVGWNIDGTQPNFGLDNMEYIPSAPEIGCFDSIDIDNHSNNSRNDCCDFNNSEVCCDVEVGGGYDDCGNNDDCGGYDYCGGCDD